MATKGIPRVGVETYNTNIKSPGINRHTTYTKGEVEELADYSKVNESIQGSITKMTEELGEMVTAQKEARTLDPDVAADLGLDPEGTYNRRDFMAARETDGMTRKEARQAWRKAKKGSEPVDVDDADTEEKKAIVQEVADEISEKADNSYTKAAEDILGGKNFNQLNRRQKVLAKKRLMKLSKAKENMGTLMSEWAGAEVDDIAWKKYNSHPGVKDFMQYIIGGEGADKDLPYTFNNDNGGTILYGNGKKLLMRDLEAGKHIYATADNKQLKADVAETTKNNVAVLLKAEDKIIKSLNDQSTRPTDETYNYNREQNIRDMVRAEYNQAMYEDVWDAEMRTRFENGRYVNYNSEKHQELVEDYLYEQYNEKMGEQAPLLKSIATPTDNEEQEINYGGGKSIGAGAYASAEKIADRLIAISNLEVVPQGMNAETMPTLDKKIPLSNSEKKKDKDLFNELDIVWNTDPDTGKRETGFSSGSLTDGKLKAIIQYGVNNNGDFSGFEANSYPEHSRKVYERWAKEYKPDDKIFLQGGTAALDTMTDEQKEQFEKNMQVELNNLLAFTDVGTAKNIKKVDVNKNKEGQTVLTLKFPSSTGSTQLVPKDYILDPNNPNGMKEIFGDLLKGAQLDAGGGINADALLDFILQQKRKK